MDTHELCEILPQSPTHSLSPGPTLLDVALRACLARIVVIAIAALAFALLPSFPSIDADYQYPSNVPESQLYIVTKNFTHYLRRELHPRLKQQWKPEVISQYCTPLGFASTPNYVHILTPFTRWDGLINLEIAQFGYGEEKSFAFYPLWPLLMREAAIWLPHTGLCPRDQLVLVGFILANFFAILSSVLLFALTLDILRDRGVEFAKRAASIYSFSAAGIFFSSLYTEPLFTALFFAFCILLRRLKAVISSLSAHRTWFAVYWILSLNVAVLMACTRSNAVVAAFYIVWELVLPEPAQHAITNVMLQFASPLAHHKAQDSRSGMSRTGPSSGQITCAAWTSLLVRTAVGVSLLFAALAPGFVYQHIGHQILVGVPDKAANNGTFFPCASSTDPELDLMGRMTQVVLVRPVLSLLSESSIRSVTKELAPLHTRELLLLPPNVGDMNSEDYATATRANKPFSNFYACLQYRYWGVELLGSYKRIANLPNVLLGLPAIFLSCRIIYSSLATSLGDYLLVLPYVVHLAFCVLVSILFIHIQVATRFLQHCPLLQWGLARLLESRPTCKIPRLASLWLLSYNIIGTIMFSLFLPFT